MKALGTDDSVNTCDCCGKSGLKSTVIVQLDNGDIAHYGSTCATRNTGKPAKQIKAEITAELDRKITEARKGYYSSETHAEYDRAIKAAHAAGIRPGRDFMTAVRAESDAADALRVAIARTLSIPAYSF